MEEMRSLGGIGLEIFSGGFNHGPDSGNIMPAYRYTKPAVCGPPTSRADQQIFTILRRQLLIDPADFSRDINRAGRVKRFRIDEHNIADFL